MSKAYDIIKNRAAQEETATLLDVLKMGAAAIETARAAGDHETCQTYNMVNAATMDVLIEREPQLDEATEEWVEDETDDRSMAQFIIDWFAYYVYETA